MNERALDRRLRAGGGGETEGERKKDGRRARVAE
jgi:hypothetical protein